MENLYKRFYKFTVNDVTYYQNTDSVINSPNIIEITQAEYNAYIATLPTETEEPIA